MTQLARATQALEVVEAMRKAGIRFVPMPVLDEECYKATVKKMLGRLQTLEERAE